jgi:hypothetical protein
VIIKNEVNGRGHWLASVMLSGPGRKLPESGHGPLFRDQRKRNTRQMRRSKLPEIERNGKEG